MKTRKGHEKVMTLDENSQSHKDTNLPRGPHKEWAIFVEKLRQELGWTLEEMCEFTRVKIGWLKKARNGEDIRGDYREKFEDELSKEWKRKFPGKPEFEWPSWVSNPPWSEQTVLSDISRIVKYAPVELIGRDDEKKLLSDAWNKVVREEKERPHVLTFVAFGGEGKTSLVAKWAVDEMLANGWPGCDAAFAWSFYNQGTDEKAADSSDRFLNAALTFFGDEEDKRLAASNTSAHEKGQRLAQLVGQRRNLLILDGLEPLQYSPSSTAFTPGKLKDDAIAKLLKDLAVNSKGLCIVTTRYSLPDLKAFWRSTAPEIKLLRLSSEAGVHLLQSLGVKGSLLKTIPSNDAKKRINEFQKLVEDVKGHALSLTLFGGFLKRAFHGDIRQRDRVKFEKADEKMDGGHAFRTMAAYEQWMLRDGGKESQREVAILRLMGLFDRPADIRCLAALRSKTIPGLTEALYDLPEDDWEYCLTGLESAKLLTVSRDGSGAPSFIDVHPLVRAYFALRVQKHQPGAWRQAHRLLFEHLRTTTPDKDDATLEDIQPLYQAVAHGCQAGLQDAASEVYWSRILRKGEVYSTYILGAHGADLGAIICFFEAPWSRVSNRLTDTDQAWMLSEAGLTLRSLGRLKEALEPMQASLDKYLELKDWEEAARLANNLSQLKLWMGEVKEAVQIAERSVTYADISKSSRWTVGTRTAYADALHQAGRAGEAEAHFREAERLQTERQAADQPEYLYSVQNFRYCDLLLAKAERYAWKVTLHGNQCQEIQTSFAESLRPLPPSALIESCRDVSKRAIQALTWDESRCPPRLGDIAFGRLSLDRAALYATVLEGGGSSLAQAVSRLEKAGSQRHIVNGFLTRAWCFFNEALHHTLHGRNSKARDTLARAKSDLDTAWEIADRGGMKLFKADIHLYRARLFFREKEYPWNKDENGKPRNPEDDLAAAEDLIKECGYHRRDEELADAKAKLF